MNSKCHNCIHKEVCKHRTAITSTPAFKIDNVSDSFQFNTYCKFYMPKKNNNYSGLNNFSNR